MPGGEGVRAGRAGAPYRNSPKRSTERCSGPTSRLHSTVRSRWKASTSGTAIGFAIPINKALTVVAEIKKGIETSSIHIGYPGFLGISVSNTQSNGATVAGTLTGGPAAKAGIAAGDVITKVGTTTITTPTQLQKAVSAHDPGSKVSVTYTDPSTGSSKTVTVTLATGPAD